MKHRGKITDIRSGNAMVEMGPEEVCSKCCSCGASKTRVIEVPVAPGARLDIGDDVEVDVRDAPMRRVYMMVYGVPLAVFVVSLSAIFYICDEPLASFAGGMVMTVIAGYVTGSSLKKRKDLCPDLTIKKSAHRVNFQDG